MEARGLSSDGDVATQSYTAVIMAGTRASGDPLATRLGTSHKCFAPIAGRSMLARVSDALARSACVGRILVCIEPAAQLPPEIEQKISDGKIERFDAAGSPAMSAKRVCERLGNDMPVLVCSGDHPLLNPTIVDYFATRSLGKRDVTVGVARVEIVRKSYPESRRTALRFCDGPFCGCNLFAFNTARASRVADFWATMESQRKRPWRLVKNLGVGPLLRYLCGRLPLSVALDVVATRLGVGVAAIELPFAEAAIDVDTPEDVAVVERIVAAVEAASLTAQED